MVLCRLSAIRIREEEKILLVLFRKTFKKAKSIFVNFFIFWIKLSFSKIKFLNSQKNRDRSKNRLCPFGSFSLLQTTFCFSLLSSVTTVLVILLSSSSWPYSPSLCSSSWSYSPSLSSSSWSYSSSLYWSSWSSYPSVSSSLPVLSPFLSSYS